MDAPPTVCLAMIVRNEGAIIRRCIESALPFVDTFCVIDTGSTDDTVAQLEQLRERLPGAQVHHSTFVNFAVNRTEVVQKAAPLADYTLLLDADFVLCVGAFDKRQLRERDTWKVEQHSPHGLSYYNTRLVSNLQGLRWEYCGVTHEFIRCASTRACTEGTIAEHALSIDDRGDGGCKEHKLTRDYALLTDGLRSEPDNARYKFYLAATCRDMKRWDEAVYWYRQCFERNWIEERFYARYQLGCCMRARGDPSHAWIEAMLAAHAFDTSRLEPLYDIVWWCRTQHKHHLGAAVARMYWCRHAGSGAAPAVPGDPKLFVSRPVYTYQFADEAMICASYADDAALAARTSGALLQQWSLVPEMHRRRIAQNLRFALKYETIDQVHELIEQSSA